jgi:quinol monooxygenase YgiN
MVSYRLSGYASVVPSEQLGIYMDAMTKIDPGPQAFLGVFHLRIKEGCVDRFLHAVAAVVPGSAKEEGLMRFEYHQNRNDPTHFTFIDIFRDEAGFQAHLRTEHQRQFQQAIQELLAVPIDGGLYSIGSIFDRREP